MYCDKLILFDISRLLECIKNKLLTITQIILLLVSLLLDLLNNLLIACFLCFLFFSAPLPPYPYLIHLNIFSRWCIDYHIHP